MFPIVVGIIRTLEMAVIIPVAAAIVPRYPEHYRLRLPIILEVVQAVFPAIMVYKWLFPS
ncbi:hypothetical protein P7H19_24665 [Paenibacillus larvae]|nr:hypothetical protein [Paenibacillus larvae]MDT2238828.1 hypothetical protein [Paenibacillus larvae]